MSEYAFDTLLRVPPNRLRVSPAGPTVSWPMRALDALSQDAISKGLAQTTPATLPFLYSVICVYAWDIGSTSQDMALAFSTNDRIRNAWTAKWHWKHDREGFGQAPRADSDTRPQCLHRACTVHTEYLPHHSPVRSPRTQVLIYPCAHLLNCPFVYFSISISMNSCTPRTFFEHKWLIDRMRPKHD